MNDAHHESPIVERMVDLVIRDAVHGDIELDSTVHAILDTRELQRLRGIKQLGLASLVYPGAVHTRFEHSLGTMAMAQRILAALRTSGASVSAVAERRVVVAALVHDVSHIPYGHTFEDERAVFARHDTPRRLQHFLSAGELGDVLRRRGLADDVAAVLVGTLPPERQWERDVVAGALDADLLDYLRRDAYFTGIHQDYDERIFRTFALDGGRLVVSMHKNGVDRADVRSEVVHLLRMRYFLSERVYYHHAKVIAGAMLSKALERGARQGLEERDLYTLSDETLLAFLASQPDPGVRSLIDGLRTRRLLKRAFVVTPATLSPDTCRALIARFHADAAARAQLETRIAEAAGVAEHEVIVSVPAATHMKEAAVLVRTGRGVVPLNDAQHSGALDIADLEARYAALWWFGVFAPAVARTAVGKAVERMLDLENEWRGE